MSMPMVMMITETTTTVVPPPCGVSLVPLRPPTLLSFLLMLLLIGVAEGSLGSGDGDDTYTYSTHQDSHSDLNLPPQPHVITSHMYDDISTSQYYDTATIDDDTTTGLKFGTGLGGAQATAFDYRPDGIDTALPPSPLDSIDMALPPSPLMFSSMGESTFDSVGSLEEKAPFLPPQAVAGVGKGDVLFLHEVPDSFSLPAFPSSALRSDELTSSDDSSIYHHQKEQQNKNGTGGMKAHQPIDTMMKKKELSLGGGDEFELPPPFVASIPVTHTTDTYHEGDEGMNLQQAYGPLDSGVDLDLTTMVGGTPFRPVNSRGELGMHEDVDVIPRMKAASASHQSRLMTDEGTEVTSRRSSDEARHRDRYQNDHHIERGKNHHGDRKEESVMSGNKNSRQRNDYDSDSSSNTMSYDADDESDWNDDHQWNAIDEENIDIGDGSDEQNDGSGAGKKKWDFTWLDVLKFIFDIVIMIAEAS